MNRFCLFGRGATGGGTDQVLDRRVVPVVYGAFNYSVAAPAGSYIDATQMGAKRLAKTLLAINASVRRRWIASKSSAFDLQRNGCAK